MNGFQIASVVVGLTGAGLWLTAALVSLPANFQATFGGAELLSLARVLKRQGWLNASVALATAISTILQTVGTIIGNK